MVFIQVNLGELAPDNYNLTKIVLTASNDIMNQLSLVCPIQCIILTYTELFQIFVLYQCPCHFSSPFGINAFNICIIQAFILIFFGCAQTNTIDLFVILFFNESDLIKRPNEWKDNMENRGMRSIQLRLMRNSRAEGNAEGCKMAMWSLW